MRTFITRLFPKRTRLTSADRNIILRSLELKMESLEPDHKTALDKRKWLDNPSPEFNDARTAHEKIYNHKPDGKVF